jgi:methionyl-tRNA formyltransferase
MKIAILGRTKILFDTAILLKEAGHEIVLVGTCKEAPEYTVTAEDFKKMAEEYGALFFYDSHINKPEIISLLKESMADIAVSVNWLNIIGAEAINTFQFGILNSHAGDLPRYRGNACPNWALLEGEGEIGVCVHFMEPNTLDSGDIINKRFFTTNRGTTIGEIYEWLYKTIPELFLEAITKLEKGTIKPEKQSLNSDDILRCYPRIPADSRIKWEKDAIYLERIVNVSSEPFSGAYTFYNMQKLIIWKAYSKNHDIPSLAIPGQVMEINSRSGEVIVACGRGGLVLQCVQIDNSVEKVLPALIIKSARDRLGINVEDEIYKLWQQIGR